MKRLARALVVVVAVQGCRTSPVVLSGGSVRVIFKGDETCGFDNPYVVAGKGCRVIDRGALLCRGFGVIDGVLFAGGCEAAAEAEVLETRGTLPVTSGEPGPPDAGSSR